MVMIREIVCATEIEKPAQSVLRYAFFIAEQFHSGLHVVHARPSEGFLHPNTYISRELRIEQSRTEQRLRERLSAIVRAIPSGASGRATTQIIDGTLSEALLLFSQRQRADLIVLEATPTTSSEADAEHPTNPHEVAVQRIATMALCPVVTVPARANAETARQIERAPTLQHILLVLEPTPQARVALDWTALFAHRFSATVEIMYPQGSPAYAVNNEERNYDVEDTLRRAGVGVEGASPAPRDGLGEYILARAEQGKCDLIVMSTRLEAVDAHSVLGQVRKHSPVPTLSVRQVAPDRLFVDNTYGAEPGQATG